MEKYTREGNLHTLYGARNEISKTATLKVSKMAYAL